MVPSPYHSLVAELLVVFPERLQLLALGSFWSFAKVRFHCPTLPVQNRPVSYVHWPVVVLRADGTMASSIAIARMR